MNLHFVDSLNHPLAHELREILSGHKNAARKIIIDDEENILQALQGKKKLTHLFTTDKTQLSRKLVSQLPPQVPIVEVSKRTCKKIFSTSRKSELFAIGELPPAQNLESLLPLGKDLVVIDGLSITGNLGAIVRTARAFDAGAIIFLNTDYLQIFDRRVVRSSRGYLFRVPVIAVDRQQFIDFCAKNQLSLVVTSSHATHEVEEVVQHPHPLALAFGGEKEGCSEELMKHAALKAIIPINPEVESLNVSVAASIFLYLRFRNRCRR